MLTRTATRRRLTAAVFTVLTVVGASSITACSMPERDAAPETTTLAAEGHVSADLPPQDPEVLLKDPQPQLPTTVTDERGKEVTVTSVDRIITLDRAGSLSRVVWTLGLGDRLVGRDISSDFPGVADLPELTPGGHAINPEAVLELNPDLIITDGTVGPVPAIRSLIDAGIPVVHVRDDQTPSTVGTLIDDVAAALGLSEQAEPVRDQITADIEQAANNAQERSDGRRMLLLYVRGTNTAMIAGESTGAGELIEMLGGVDAAEDAGISEGYSPMTPEALAAARPDTVIVMTRGLDSVGGVDGLVDIPGMAQTPAGANKSVLDVPDTMLLSFGPQTALVITAMADALYGPAPEGA
ncbi:ABC transporter substrate-binding protein [Corynebacterium sp. TAE3-ERU12]|uniref:heme/hemin ABC transporter substrate-binding protein n=1 Tax=Corynebacterium sp. TAE3-ERU12 TaxID=2849491 RepID=UPI001C4872E6|nr:ABC transporter substrate-binding protein [Corynebacterium sp. TAE3-ERU12]MBV7295746.1 ABC transporter substrate-binding protein [Corynebacterium sp. TAE3-ERU12]